MDYKSVNSNNLLLSVEINKYLWDIYNKRFDWAFEKFMKVVSNDFIKVCINHLNILHKLEFLLYREIIQGKLGKGYAQPQDFTEELKQENKKILFTIYLLGKYLINDKVGGNKNRKFMNRILYHYGGAKLLQELRKNGYYKTIKEIIQNDGNVKEIRSLINWGNKLTYEFLMGYPQLQRMYNLNDIYSIITVSNFLLFSGYLTNLSVLYSIDKFNQNQNGKPILYIHPIPIFLMTYLRKYKQDRLMHKIINFYRNGIKVLYGDDISEQIELKPLFMKSRFKLSEITKAFINQLFRLLKEVGGSTPNTHFNPELLIDISENPTILRIDYLINTKQKLTTLGS